MDASALANLTPEQKQAVSIIELDVHILFSFSPRRPPLILQLSFSPPATGDATGPGPGEPADHDGDGRVDGAGVLRQVRRDERRPAGFEGAGMVSVEGAAARSARSILRLVGDAIFLRRRLIIHRSAIQPGQLPRSIPRRAKSRPG